MLNPFTLQSRITQLQKDVLGPLYTMHVDQEKAEHNWLLYLTGKKIEEHRLFIEELSQSRLLAVAFSIIKILGGADSLSNEDFDRFSSYVRNGGITAMVKMLLSTDKEKTFIAELRGLPADTRRNASAMLAKSATLHEEYMTDYFKQNYGSEKVTPQKLLENKQKSTAFINTLANLAREPL